MYEYLSVYHTTCFTQGETNTQHSDRTTEGIPGPARSDHLSRRNARAKGTTVDKHTRALALLLAQVEVEKLPHIRSTLSRRHALMKFYSYLINLTLLERYILLVSSHQIRVAMAQAVVGRVASKFPRVLCRRWVSMSAVRRVFEVADERDFQTRVLGSRKPVVVDFHAE